MIKPKWHIHAKHGLLELCVLNIVKKKPAHGYRIAEEFKKSSDLVVPEGTVYPLLRRLKKEGHVKIYRITSPNGPRRKTYEITSSGRNHVKDLNKMWRKLTKAIDEIID